MCFVFPSVASPLSEPGLPGSCSGLYSSVLTGCVCDLTLGQKRRSSRARFANWQVSRRRGAAPRRRRLPPRTLRLLVTCLRRRMNRRLAHKNQVRLPRPRRRSRTKRKRLSLSPRVMMMVMMGTQGMEMRRVRAMVARGRRCCRWEQRCWFHFLGISSCSWSGGDKSPRVAQKPQGRYEYDDLRTLPQCPLGDIASLRWNDDNVSFGIMGLKKHPALYASSQERGLSRICFRTAAHS